MAKYEITREEFEKFESPPLGKAENLINKQFGELKVLKYAGLFGPQRKPSWYCSCSCNNPNIIGPIKSIYLKSGKIQSCGCKRRELISKKKSTYNKIEFINNEVIKVYVGDKYFICDYKDWIEYGCNKIKWCFKVTDNLTYVSGYIKRSKNKNGSKNGLRVRFHRFIIGAKREEYADHQNGCTLDNRRKNLRVCTPQENNRNRRINTCSKSGYKGVSWHKNNQKWVARIMINEKQIHLGCFDNKEDAIKARQKAEEEYFGEFSIKNSRGENNIISPKTIDEIVEDIIKGVD